MALMLLNGKRRDQYLKRLKHSYEPIVGGYYEISDSVGSNNHSINRNTKSSS
jgi:hypothetical protein